MKQSYNITNAALIKGKVQLIYAGLSPPWYGISPFPNICIARVFVENATIMDNTAQHPANVITLLPSQIACERIDGGAAIIHFDGVIISGDPEDDIGVYLWDSMTPTINATFGPIAEPFISEAP